MHFRNREILTYVKNYSTQNVRNRVHESVLQELKIEDNIISATVFGTKKYAIRIEFNDEKIKSSKCSCPFDQAGICKHIILVLQSADLRLKFKNSTETIHELEEFTQKEVSTKFLASSPNFEFPHRSTFVFENFSFDEVNNAFIEKFSAIEPQNIVKRNSCDNFDLTLNHGQFYNVTSHWDNSRVNVDFLPETKELHLICECKLTKRKMCLHQTAMLFILKNNQEIAFYFDKNVRNVKFKEIATNYGLENEENLDDYFTIEKKYGSVYVVPKKKELIALNSDSHRVMSQKLLPDEISLKDEIKAVIQLDTEQGLIFSQSRYTDNFFLYFFEAKLSKEGKIKNPLTEISAVIELDKYEDVNAIRFLSSLSFFKDHYENKISNADKIKALKIIARNPLNMKFYYHDTKISDNITANSVKQIEIIIPEFSNLSFGVKQNDSMYEILPYIHINNQKINLRAVKLRYQFIFLHEAKFYLIDNAYYLKIYQFFKEHNFKLIIHESKFDEFKELYLNNLENKVEINYTFIKPATKKQLESKGFEQEIKKMIYLTESDNYILITPSMRYGNLEIPILSLKQIHDRDDDNQWFTVERDKLEEHKFAGLLLRQHPEFEEQLGQFEYLYLHKNKFLDSGWFIDAFETWKNHDIEILGFNKLNTKISMNKIKVAVAVNSGLDWFDTSLKVKFGNEDISLKQIQKAIKNANRFITLGDGSLGLMPEEWIEKFSKYFRSGDVHEGIIRTSKMNFSVISELYEDEVLNADVKEEIAFLNSKIASFKTIHDVKVPKALKATLRDYQKQGLNWLNFLDEFNFGGCLADDMGLGKTIQIIAFILAQKEKDKTNTNLIILPTSLIFNWTREIEKFAPSLKILTIYGQSRVKNTKEFSKYDVVLTSYGTMLSDIKILKSFRFNYIFLDESQAIKNPESQRYKAVRLLDARNRVVLTGTPIENNTFDLYAQMSFASPGLFGSQQRFKDEFSTPIDRFKDIGRAKELQQKINPFILRRTKKQVAKELPEKTEMVLFCEMDAEQRQVYETYKNDIREKLLGKHPDSPENKSMLVLQGLTKLRQICNSPALLSDEESYGSSSAKMRVLIEEIEMRSKNHKILVFSQFVGMLDLIRVELDKLEISHEYLTGQTKDREEKVHAFQNDSEIRVFLISLKAGGTGLNLTEADYVYLVDPWWNPAVENQAIDRCYRIGQKKNVVAVRLITPETIEEKIMQMQENKRELAEDIIKTDANVLKSLSQEDLIGLFS
ncbi:MAG: SNF2-related protein [Bacteroidota bacterium]